MKHHYQTSSPSQVVRLGRRDAEEQVRQAVASVTLEGLQPSKLSVMLARSVANGQISTEDALTELRGMYARST